MPAMPRYLHPPHASQVIYVETMSNPLLAVPDLPAVVAFAQRHGLTSIIDNTFGTPANFRPVHHGFHMVLHSATKYLNGHSDVIAGAVAGSAELVAKVGGWQSLVAAERGGWRGRGGGRSGY